MDEIVAAAMKKWPDVPDVYGWLRLDRRGNWLLRNEPIGNATLRAFIDRNYMCDERGCWYFQNGPQRVFVSLAATPYVYALDRAAGGLSVTAHTGEAAKRVDACWLVDDGSLLLQADLGPGLVHDRDLALAFDAMRDAHGQAANEHSIAGVRAGNPQALGIEFAVGNCSVAVIASEDVARHLHFEPDPKPAPASSG